jgi:hypothetical protein
VARIAARQGLAPRLAADLALIDARFAAGARARLDRSQVTVIERAALARALLERLGAEAESAGEPSEAELAELVKERWLELARPDAVRTTHAVVLVDKPERDTFARELAEKLQKELASAGSAAELKQRALAFPAHGLSVRAEDLPFVCSDGRVFIRRDNGFAAQRPFDLEFARAANEIREPGQLSRVVKSAFGYHVIRLEERLPGVTMAAAELRTKLRAEVVIRRAARARAELVKRLKHSSPVQVERSADELTSQIKVSP